MKLTNLRTVIDDPSLILPIGDVDYQVPPCTAELWLKLQEHQHRIEQSIKAAPDTADVAALGNDDDPTGIDLYREALGPVYEQLLTAGVSLAELTVAGMTAYLWQLGGERNTAAAQAIWESGGKALAPAVAALTSRTPSDSSGDAATSTPSPASTSGTRNPAKKAAAKKAASRTRSPKSSQTAN